MRSSCTSQIRSHQVVKRRRVRDVGKAGLCGQSSVPPSRDHRRKTLAGTRNTVKRRRSNARDRACVSASRVPICASEGPARAHHQTGLSLFTHTSAASFSLTPSWRTCSATSRRLVSRISQCRRCHSRTGWCERQGQALQRAVDRVGVQPPTAVRPRQSHLRCQSAS